MALNQPLPGSRVMQRWTRNPATVIAGNAVEGWDADYDALPSIEEKADVAARLATYENAIFTITTTLGLIGLLLWARALYWLYRPFTGTILRRGIRHSDHALMFVAVQSLIVYLGFSWIAGGYPSTLCVWGVLAAVMCYELRRVTPPRADKRAAS